MQWTRSGRRVVGVGAIALTLALGVASPARADEPTTAAEARERVAQLQREQSSIEAQFNAAQTKAKDLRAKAATQQAELDELAGKVETQRAQVSQFALSEYKQNGLPQVAALATNPDKFLRQADTAVKYADTKSNAVRGLQNKESEASEVKRGLEANLAAATAEEKRMEDLRGQAKSKVAEAEKVVNQLDAKEKAAYEAERQRAAAAEQASRDAARADLERAARQGQPTQQTQQPSQPAQPTPTQPQPTQPVPAPAGSAAQIAVAFALSKQGAPYEMGGTGPAYDCSGLVMMSYRAAGISLPRTSDAQIASGPSVPMSALQPGDIIGYYGGSHVGIYVGGGMVMHALDYGKPAQVTGLYALGGPTSATRVA